MKKILIAVDSFKGSLSSDEAAGIIKNAFSEIIPEISAECISMADGGEGLCEAVYACKGGEYQKVAAHDPIGRGLEASYLVLPDKTAVIESAAACGMSLLEGKLMPLDASTCGVGEMISDALSRGCEKIIIGLGGSATTDGGSGCLSSLGVKFYDKNEEILKMNSRALAEIYRADFSALDKRLEKAQITLLCDVSNPLYGENGAAYIFSPQKGANPEEVKFLDSGLRNFSKKVFEAVGLDISAINGGGAAGGMCAGLYAAGAKIQSGADFMLKISDFAEKAREADLVITGEGRLDSQTSSGKLPMGVAHASGETPVVAVCGELTAKTEELALMKIIKAFAANEEHLPFEKIKARSAELLYEAAKKAAHWSAKNIL